MKRVLMVYGEPFVYGGQETFSINLYKEINKEKVQFDFYTPFFVKNKTLCSMLKNNFFYSDERSFNVFLRKINFVIGFNKYIKKNKNEYDIVHINSGSSFILAKGAKIAKKAGIKKVIVHSHSSGRLNFKHRSINKLLEKDFKKSDLFLACSAEAAVCRFPRFVIKNNLYKIIANGIDLEKYKFDEQIRKKYRNKLKIKSDEILLGNVGRLSEEKNQIFILEILEKLVKTNNKYKLLLIGDGPLKEKIINKINMLNLNTNVIMLEKRNDVNNLLMAMDIFVFPSIYEGLGIALIEAEATGVPSLCSKGIPSQTIINDNCFCIENFMVNDWINKLESIKLNRKSNYMKLKYYSINNTIEQIYEVYNIER